MKQEFYKMEYEDWDEGVEIFGTGQAALALEGAYLRLCHLMYRRRGPVTNDAKVLAHLWRVDVSAARKILQRLIDFGKVILLESGGFITNIRVQSELDSRGILSEVRADSGRKGGKKSGESRANQLDLLDVLEPNASSETKQNPQSRVEYSRVDKDSSPAVGRTSEPEGFSEFWNLYPQRDGENPRKPALEKFKTAIAQGVTAAEIIEGTRRFAAHCRAEKTIGTRYIPMAKAWLFQSRWVEFLSKGGNVGVAPGQERPAPVHAIPRHGEVITAAMCPGETQKQHIGKVHLHRESAEWGAWMFHYSEAARAQGKQMRTVPTYFFEGWSFPARWPPGHVQGKAKADSTGVH